MKSKTYLQIFLLILVASISLFLFSYSHKATTSDKEDTNGQEKCCQKKVHSEFILWESLSRNLLSASR